MFIPASALTSGVYDCFIIGSGPAGVSVALTLAAAGKRVLLFESGEEQRVRSDLANSIGYGHYSGEYWNAHWIRMLGGTSNVWTGWCTTPGEIDLENPAVGVTWPINRAELLPYWRKAAPILDRNPAFIDFETPLTQGFLYKPVPTGPPMRVASKYLEVLKASRQIDVVLGTSVVGFDATESRSSLTRLAFFDHQLKAGRRLVIRPAQSVVVAAGAMGNAQLLLQPRPDGAIAIGNESGQVGRFLMEHPQFNAAGECVMEAELDRYWPAEHKSPGVHAIIGDRSTLLEHGLYGCSLQCSRKTADHVMARYLTAEGGKTFYHYDITARAEMLPSPSNRVFLTAEKDASGLHRPAARCVLDARDFMNAERTLRAFADTLIRLNRGRVRVNNDRIYMEVRGEGHTMGTTRMGTQPSTSVVDRECRVHGYNNFFVAGSSVFPTGGGYANPTVTIVALALRLADTLLRR
jgi:choline dehydrogenase-like flavoprotein